ncbi:MAG: T9SS type A sorting domain-containing protein, partial [Candidatus Electryoneaceae bacterium]|nr:T9SS type A sorting domain-containing protein [Candidatus Electryoneaceae bacterium]
FSVDMPNGDYYVNLEMCHNAVGEQYDIPIHFNIGPQPGVFGDERKLPTGFRFDPPYPNPFNPTTRLTFILPSETPVELTFWDTNGRLVDRMELGRLSAGRHQVDFDGNTLSSGIYFARITAGGQSASHKLLLIR